MPLDTVVWANAESDPDTACVWAFHEQLRADAHRAILTEQAINCARAEPRLVVPRCARHALGRPNGETNEAGV